MKTTVTAAPPFLSYSFPAWLRERSLRPDARFPYLFLSERGPFTRQAVNYIILSAGERA